MIKNFITSAVLIVFAQLMSAQSFTVNLQPTTNGIDANVSSNDPVMNYGSDNEIRFSRSMSDVTERSFLKFDLTSIPAGADIISANLILYGVDHTMPAMGAGVLQLVPDSWSEENVNWNLSRLLKSSTMPSVGISPPGSPTQNYTLDVGEMVQAMVNSPLINFGWMFSMDDETSMYNQQFGFASGDNSTTSLCPVLLITYCTHISVNAYVSPATSTTSANAGINLDVRGGVPPYSYSWSNSSSSKEIFNITPGLYTVTITDSRPVTVSKIIPVSGNCGVLTFSLNTSSSGFTNSKLVNQSFNPNTANSNFQNAVSLEATNVPDVGGNTTSRSLFAFDFTELPDNVTVSSAKMVLQNNAPPQASLFKVQLGRITGDWNSRTSTYNDQPGYNSSASDLVEFNYDGTAASYNVDVSAQVQSMLNEKSSLNGWMMKLKGETPEESGISAKFTTPMLTLVLQMPTYACDDTQLNWNQETTYDVNGNVLSSEKTYLDNLGRMTQKLVKNASGEVFRTQSVYDSYGLSALNSMPAYSGSSLTYQTNFMLNTFGQVYSYTDFDVSATLNSNTPVQSAITNCLGYYYSDLNTYDAYQATTGNPYSRVENTGAGAKTRSSIPGNTFKMGSGKESLTFNLVSGDELKYIFGTSGSNYYSYKAVQSSTNALDCDPMAVDQPILASKQIVITPDNPEMISYTVGDKVVATCYSGLSATETYTNMTVVTNTMMYAGTKCIDIHLPYADRNTLGFPIPASVASYTAAIPSYTNILYTITDLQTDRLLVAGVDYSLSSTYTVGFSSAFQAVYANKSMLLRISYDFGPLYYAGNSHSAFPDVLVKYRLSYGRASKNYYDLGSSLRKTVSPKGFNIATPATNSMVTTYDYDHHGQVIGAKSPDQGIMQMVYTKQGQLRFSQNADQKTANYFSYVNYDKHGRAYETGENRTSGAAANSIHFSNYYNISTYSGSGASSSTIIDLQDGLLAADKGDVTLSSYTVPASADNIPSGYTYQGQYQKFRNGALNFIKNANSTVWYNYDKLDRSLATITQVTEPDFVAKRPTLNDRIKTSEGTYDYYTGLSTNSTYQTNNSSEYLRYAFTYDSNLRPTVTQLTYGAVTETLSTLSYNKMGQVKRKVIGKNYQGLDYVYTLNGGLKAMNHPGLDATLDPGGDAGNFSGSGTGVNTDLFGELIEFYENDYIRSGTNIVSSIGAGLSTYDGLIHAVRFKTQNVVNTTTTGANFVNYPSTTATLITSTNYKNQELRNEYTYDEFNQLAGSYFEGYNNSTKAITAYSHYQETGNTGFAIGYDKNGNITRLVRNATGTTVFDDLTYTNGSTTNQLTAIQDAAVNSFPASVNFKTPSTGASSSFSYNANGALYSSPSESISSITYFPGGKIKKITFTNSNTSEFEYGAMGEKLKSKFHNNSANKNKYTWYVGPYVYELDEAGVNTFAIKEANISGGVARVSSGTNIGTGYLVFNITDHLGNARVSFTKKTSSNTSGTGIDVLSYNDYYAFGGPLPGRSFSMETYRYGYQGQEKAQDGTNWDQFELRSYNHDLGRWFCPDPYGQFASPYLAMGNNPVSNIDPDGGYTRIRASYEGLNEDDKLRISRGGKNEYSDDTQESYEKYVQRLVDRYIKGNDMLIDGQGRDATKFIEAMTALNSYYQSLGNIGVGLGTQADYLSQSEIGLNVPAMVELAAASRGRVSDAIDPKSVSDTDNGPESYVKENLYGGSAAGRTSTYATNIMSDGRRVQTEYKTDGSEEHTYFNAEGEVTSVGYRSADYVKDYNKRLAGTSFETTQYMNSGAVQGGGGMTFPSFSTLWGNYPQDVNGSHAHPSVDSYPNQCAIRVSDAFQKSGIDMSSYPKVNKTSDGYARSSKGLADWTWQNFGKPKIMSQDAFEKNYSNSTGLMYIAPPPGGVGHIDLFNAGSTGSGYYLGSEIWFWPIK